MSHSSRFWIRIYSTFSPYFKLKLPHNKLQKQVMETSLCTSKNHLFLSDYAMNISLLTILRYSFFKIILNARSFTMLKQWGSLKMFYFINLWLYLPIYNLYKAINNCKHRTWTNPQTSLLKCNFVFKESAVPFTFGGKRRKRQTKASANWCSRY